MFSVNTYERFNPFEDERLKDVPVMLPHVSIVVTNYNYSQYVGACISSIADQTYQDIDCVVVDDCSTDDSVSVIRGAISSCPHKEKFALMSTKQNRGQMAAMKEGLSRVRGQFIVMMDSDDILLNDFVEAHVKAHLGRVTVALTSSIQYQIDGRGEIVGGNHHDHQNSGQFRHVYHKRLQKPFWLWATCSSMMFRRAALDLAMPDNHEDEFRICADNYVVHFCNLIGGSLLIPSIHGCYRRHGRNGFGKNPIIGGHLPVGDMSEHPEHEVVRKMIIERLFKIYPRVKQLTGEGGFLNLLMRTCFFRELADLKTRYPHVLKRGLLYYRKQFVRFQYLYQYWGMRGKIRKVIHLDLNHC